jgi:hypothetical protein
MQGKTIGKKSDFAGPSMVMANGMQCGDLPG